jgi:2'-5' RNA ligase
VSQVRIPQPILNLPEPYRCFTGLSSTPEVVDQFYQSLAPLRKALTQVAPPGAKLRWTHAQDLHITLEFFQGLSLGQLEKVIEAMDHLCPGSVSESESRSEPESNSESERESKTLPIIIKFDRVLLLPTPRKPRVLALGLSNQSVIQELAQLRQRFLDHLYGISDFSEQQATHQVQFQETGSKHYLPHLTIARFKPADSPKPQDLANLPGVVPDIPVSLVQLYLSFAGRPEAQRHEFNQLFELKVTNHGDLDSGNHRKSKTNPGSGPSGGIQYPVIHRVC